MKAKPVTGLKFSWADGRVGSTMDYLGGILAILIVSLECPYCKQAMGFLREICAQSNTSHLALADRSRPAAPFASDIQADFERAFATLPEIYLGLDVPRGTWIKFPTLILLDETARVTFFCSDKDKLVDQAFLRSVLPSGSRGQG